MKDLYYLGCLFLLAFFINKAESVITCDANNKCPADMTCNSGKCECPNGMIINEAKKICDCPENYVKLTNPTRCLPVALYPGFGCEVNEQCQNLGAVGVDVTCIASKCKCPEGTHVPDSGHKCYKNILLGNACTTTEECTTQANPYVLCNATTSKCECIEGFKEDPKHPKICAPGGNSVQPGDSCMYDPYCRGFLGNGSICVEQTCDCLDNYHFGNNSQKCLVNKLLDEACEDGEECYLTKSNATVSCINKKCSCVSGFASEDKQECYNAASINQSIIGLLVISLLSVFFRSSS